MFRRGFEWQDHWLLQHIVERGCFYELQKMWRRNGNAHGFTDKAQEPARVRCLLHFALYSYHRLDCALQNAGRQQENESSDFRRLSEMRIQERYVNGKGKETEGREAS